MFEGSGFDSVEEEIERGSFEVVDTLLIFDEFEFMCLGGSYFRTGNDLENIASTHSLGETGDENRDGWSGFIEVLPTEILEESHTTMSRSTDDIVSFFDGSGVDEDG